MDLSIVIPTFNESQKIKKDIIAAADFLKSAKLTGEIIVVDDGGHDQTDEAAKSVAVPQGIELHILRHQTNHGKGYAVKTGMALTKGRYVMFADSGCCTDYRFALQGLELLSKDACDLAYGSRKMTQSVIKKPQHWTRRLASKAFRQFILAFMQIPGRFTDTQCGFKLYKGDIGRELYRECITDGFTFDVEIILRALKKGYRIIEFPIEWHSDRDTRVRFFEMTGRLFPELLRIKREIAKIT